MNPLFPGIWLRAQSSIKSRYTGSCKHSLSFERTVCKKRFQRARRRHFGAHNRGGTACGSAVGISFCRPALLNPSFSHKSALQFGPLFKIPLTRTNVRCTIEIEQIFYICRIFSSRGIKGGLYMTGWTLFFIVIGVSVLTAQLFRVIDAIEHPRRFR